MRSSKGLVVYLLVSLLMCCSLVSLGCRGQDKIQRKTVRDLYCEAVHMASQRPPVIQATPAAAVWTPEQTEDVTSPAGQPPETLPVPKTPIVPTLQTDSPVRAAESFHASPPPHLSGPLLPLPLPQARPLNVVATAGLPADPVALPLPVAAHWQAHVQTISYSQPSQQHLVTDDRDEEDVREVIRSLAEQAQVSVIVDELVGGVATIHCVNEPFEKALQKVLTPLGLCYALVGVDYIVAPADPQATLFQHIATRIQYSPRYHDIATLTQLLPARFKPFLQISSERNLVLIEAPESISNELVKCLRELDTPVPQVELEAIVCVTAPDSAFRFGLDWGHMVKVNNADALSVSMTGLAFSGSSSGNGVHNAFSDFAVTSAFVRLLAQEGYITIRAAPRVTAKDGEKASISINRETFFSLQPTNSNLLFRQDVQKVEAGIMLDIVPRVHDDIVTVQIVRAEVSEDIRASESRPELTNNPYPIINRRQVSTEVNVRDGHTIVIGGLVQRQTVDRVNRIPVISSVPMFGKLFETIEKQEQEAEVAIFISPRIVHGDSCAVQ